MILRGIRHGTGTGTGQSAPAQVFQHRHQPVPIGTNRHEPAPTGSEPAQGWYEYWLKEILLIN